MTGLSQQHRILITGNLGYVGSVLAPFLRKKYPDSIIIGFDAGYFSHLCHGKDGHGIGVLDKQIFGDVRNFPSKLLEGVQIVIHLAALSNDPIGNKFGEATLAINLEASKRLADAAKQHGVSQFIFASSCSVYGFASADPRVESDELNPLTEYSRSKIYFEEYLKSISGSNFKCFALRFATACGASPRLRFDLVLNDFVFNAMTNGVIKITSNGRPWRPLIDVQDMCRAITWPIDDCTIGDGFNCYNVGNDDNNFTVLGLAELVAQHFNGVDIEVNSNAPDDARSYKVSFAKFKQNATNHYPSVSISDSIQELSNVILSTAAFSKESTFRLKILERLVAEKKLDDDLFWQC